MREEIVLFARNSTEIALFVSGVSFCRDQCHFCESQLGALRLCSWLDLGSWPGSFWVSGSSDTCCLLFCSSFNLFRLLLSSTWTLWREIRSFLVDVTGISSCSLLPLTAVLMLPRSFTSASLHLSSMWRS